MDVASIAALLGSVKTATDIAKLFKDSNLSFEKAEGKLKLAELVSALADVKLEASEVQQMLLEKDERIRELERELQIKANLKWKEPCYWMVNTEQGEEEPYCQHCYDSSHKLMHLHADGHGLYQCRVCNKIFKTRERAVSDAKALHASRARREVIARGL
jgi:hypothetical protein